MKYKLTKYLFIFKRWANTPKGEKIVLRILVSMVVLLSIDLTLLLTGYLINVFKYGNAW